MLVTIMTDASVDQRLQVAGFGYWIACERGKQGGGGGLKSPIVDSYIGELCAVVNALHIALQRSLVIQGDKVLVQLDNLGVVTLLNNRTPSTRADVTEAMTHLTGMLKKHFITLEARHVKGHSDSSKGARYASNNHCDRFAWEAMNKKRKNKIRNQKKKATKDEAA